MQKKSDLRLVLMSATGDHNLVRKRIPKCQQLVMKGVMHKVKRCFLEHPLDRSSNLLNQMAQIVITYHNERVGRPLVDETCHSKSVNESNKIMVFLPGLAQIFQFCEILQRVLDLGWTEMLIHYLSMVRVRMRMWKQCYLIQQCLPQLVNTHWVRIRVCLLLSPMRCSLLLMPFRSYGLHIENRGSLDRALCALMLQNQDHYPQCWSGD